MKPHWWQGEPAILRTGERFDRTLVTVLDVPWTLPGGSERAVVQLADGGTMTAFVADMHRPRGIFPRDDLAFPADYNGDFCPRESYERAAFLKFLDAELHGMSFTAFVHYWRRHGMTVGRTRRSQTGETAVRAGA